LLCAMAEVIHAEPQARLVVIGDGDDRSELAEFGAELELSANLLFTGEVSAAELDRWYRGAQVFALPAEREGFGLVYLEAMGRGLPVVAGASGASLEIIEDGKTGFLVAPDDHHALSRQIIRLLRDRHLQAAIGSAARARFVERFTEAQFAMRLYRTLDLESAAEHQTRTGSAA
ncbi:MAG TPA: glycosyltransferase family 4 protein, partial [Candidatus Binataceae bacterium]|nr:glycosyltransferase family 4 protein [Candidatus Binataceae bacterium]